MTAQDLYDLIFNAAWQSIDSDNGSIYGIVEIPATDGSITIIEVSGSYETAGYCEDDYFSGTGNWVTTFAEVTINGIEATATDENDDEIENDITRLAREINLASLEKELRAELWAA